MPLFIVDTVRNISITPVKSEYVVGEELWCNALGNPRPDIWWQEVNVSQSDTGSLLHITTDMLGLNTWTCVAQNTLHDNITTQQMEITFTGV